MDSKARLAVSLILAGASWSARANEGYIRLNTPSTYRVESDDAGIQGSVDLPALRRLEITVEPFLSKTAAPLRRDSWAVSEESFQGTIRLFPGINLVTLASQTGPVQQRFVLFRPAPPDPSLGVWGESPLVSLSAPQELRTAQARITIAGFLESTDAEHADVIVLSDELLAAMDALPSDKFRAMPPAPFYRFSIYGNRFQGDILLNPGGNLILIRTGATPNTRAQTAVRTIFYEPASARLSLEPAVLTDGALRVRGRSKTGRFHLSLTAILSRSDGTGLRPTVLWEQDITPTAEGAFEAVIPTAIAEKNLRIRGFPRLEARRGHEHTLQVLLDWPGAQ